MERSMEELLCEASLEGNISTLLMLLQEDPLILNRVTLNRQGDMPLHIASTLGHTDFVKEILTRNPHLATECDSQKHLPLHLAAAKGHVEVVKALVSANPGTCHARDRDGGNPVHLAAVRGHLDVVKEMVQAQPHSARAMVQQDTILHLCVKHGQFEVLKFLIETTGDHEFVNTKDGSGNTVLHLAVADKQIQIINFLLLDARIEVNATNTKGETPTDILAQVTRDLKYQQIMQSLTLAGGVAQKPETSFAQVPKSSRSKMQLDRLEYHQTLPFSSHSKHHLTHYEDWLDRKRNSLMVVASLIATMAFQAGTNPPSGVWQDDSNNNDPLRKAGFAVMASNHQDLYHIFLICNTVGFVSTLSIILLLISGLPCLRHRFFLWILMVIMWIATTSMSLAYLVSIRVLTPNPESELFRLIAQGIVVVWIGLLTLLLVGHTLRLIAIAFRGFRRLLFPRKKQVLVPIV
uniref:ankyrin repeat-containing protein BDA1-like n=1 Tax=Erigeron canadensis TaxID=72917 RepID=UPI001CB8AD8E|nr:ankyrin repeat-containing protein BDA1-like [Erigeron canadensis]